MTTPRWVKIAGITTAALVLLVVVLALVSGGNHGPGRHSSSGELSVVESDVRQG